MRVKTIKWRDSAIILNQEPIDTNWQVEVLTSVGFVLEDNKDHIVLAGDIIRDDVRRVIVIPKENIIK